MLGVVIVPAHFPQSRVIFAISVDLIFINKQSEKISEVKKQERNRYKQKKIKKKRTKPEGTAKKEK